MIKILFITTSHATGNNISSHTGLWLEEFSSPYYYFIGLGAGISVASALGGMVPLDPRSLSIFGISQSGKKLLKDSIAMYFLEHALTIKSINESEYDMVFLCGGNGAIWDFYNNSELKSILQAFLLSNKPIGAVSHGAIAFFNLTNERGQPVLKDLLITGFSNSEELSSGVSESLPFLLENELNNAGAKYSKGPDFLCYMVSEKNFVFGQNPASSLRIAEKMYSLRKL